MVEEIDFLGRYQSVMSTLAPNHSGGSVSAIGLSLGRVLSLRIQISVSAGISDPASPSALSATNTLTPTTRPLSVSSDPAGSQGRANERSLGLMKPVDENSVLPISFLFSKSNCYFFFTIREVMTESVVVKILKCLIYFTSVPSVIVWYEKEWKHFILQRQRTFRQNICQELNI